MLKSQNKKNKFQIIQILVVLIFLLGLCFRLTILFGTHNEGDELIYMTLVDQIDNGAGYTLRGSFLLEQGLIDRNIYDTPIFFHPPGGVGLFWLFFKIFGNWGYVLVQLLSYTMFFWSMLLLARNLQISKSKTGLILLAGLTAFNPIMAHVTTHFWLDGPLLAFCTMAIALYISGITESNTPRVFYAGLLLGYASLIKVTAFLILPGVAILSWRLVCSQTTRYSFFKMAAWFIIPAVIIQAPWEYWQWLKLDSTLPFLANDTWAGKPAGSLMEANPYINFLTKIRSPWIYLSLTPRIVWTLLPSIVLSLLYRKNHRIRSYGAVFFIWIALILFFHIILGFAGYSKVIRYVILLTPASILFFSMIAAEIDLAGQNVPHGFHESYLFSVILFGAFFLEIVQGVISSLNYNLDLIIPLL